MPPPPQGTPARGPEMPPAIRQMNMLGVDDGYLAFSLDHFHWGVEFCRDGTYDAEFIRQLTVLPLNHVLCREDVFGMPGEPDAVTELAECYVPVLENAQRSYELAHLHPVNQFCLMCYFDRYLKTTRTPEAKQLELLEAEIRLDRTNVSFSGIIAAIYDMCQRIRHKYFSLGSPLVPNDERRQQQIPETTPFTIRRHILYHSSSAALNRAHHQHRIGVAIYEYTLLNSLGTGTVSHQTLKALPALIEHVKVLSDNIKLSENLPK